MSRGAVVIIGLTLALGACEGGGDPVEQALRDAAAARQAAATPTTAELEARRPAVSDDQTYVAEAIEENRRAIALAETALRESGDPEIQRMARAAIERHRSEIETLQAWRPADATNQ